MTPVLQSTSSKEVSSIACPQRESQVGHLDHLLPSTSGSSSCHLSSQSLDNTRDCYPSMTTAISMTTTTSTTARKGNLVEPKNYYWWNRSQAHSSSKDDKMRTNWLHRRLRGGGSGKTNKSRRGCWWKTTKREVVITPVDHLNEREYKEDRHLQQQQQAPQEQESKILYIGFLCL
jgi:hypothetical protein